MFPLIKPTSEAKFGRTVCLELSNECETKSTYKIKANVLLGYIPN